jgi:acetolactate synthase I/II/III large subunit
MATAGHHILRVLRDAGVPYIFGVPGGGTVGIFTESPEVPDGVEALLVRTETQAAIMADAYARASRQPVAIMGQGAFMGSYAVFGVTEAFHSSSPMIVFGDTSDNNAMPLPTSQNVTGDYGHADLLGIMRHITKYATLATTPREAVLGTHEALRHATSGAPGPAAVVMRSAAVVGDIDEATAADLHNPKRGTVLAPPAADAPSVDEAAAALVDGERPVIIAGKGVHNAAAHAELRELASLLGAAVTTSYKGKSAIAESDPLALGMMGTYGRAVANDTVRDADVVLVVGAKLTGSDRAGGRLVDSARQTVVQVDVEPRHVGWSVPVDVPLVGDARVVLRQLVTACRARGPERDRAERTVASLAERRATDPLSNDDAVWEESSPVMPQRLVRLLQENLDPMSNVTLDAGFNRVWMCLFFETQKPWSLFAPGGLAGMGWALPGALGVKLARPDEPSVAVAGDGGFMMAISALATAVEHDIPVVCVVMNDAGLGMVRHHQGGREVASNFGSIDHAAIARGFGADGVRVDDSRDLPAAIKDAQAANRPTVIDVVVNRDVNPDRYRARPRQLTET